VARRLTVLDGLVWAVAVAVLGAVVYLSLGPPSGPSPFALADKVKHLVAYTALTLAFLLAAAWRPGLHERPSRTAVLAVVAGAVALGILLELLQAVDPFATRQADVLDGIADALGAGLGFLVWSALRLPATRASRSDVP
jgi:VanZ family protein